MKTTNAKTKAFQTPAQDIEKTQIKPTSTRRVKPKTPSAETSKLQVLGDDPGPLEEPDVEYCPPRPKDLPYESEDFPADTLGFDGFRGGNLTRGYQGQYFNRVDKDGKTRQDREQEASRERAFKEADDKIMRSIEEDSWAIGDVPETWETNLQKTVQMKRIPNSKAPPTIASRKAASALSVVPKAPAVRAKPAPRKAPISFVRPKRPAMPAPSNSSMRHTVATAASRSTIGYTKGRSTSGALHRDTFLQRSSSNMSTGSNSTITPNNFAQRQADNDSQPLKRLEFLSLFEPEDEDVEPELTGALPDCLRGEDEDDEEEEFVLKLKD
jgi:hypothetical protein